MRDLNRIELIGTIGKGYQDNPAVKIGPAGDHTKAQFTIVCKNEFNGNVYETFIRVSAWNALADAVAGMQEGDRIYVEGSWQNGSYEGKGEKEGQKIRYSEVNARIVEGMGGAGAGSEVVADNAVALPVGGARPDDNDDLPF